MNLSTKIFKTNIIIFLCMAIISCDPGFDEHIKIINNTEADLQFSLDFSPTIEFDTLSLFLANRLLPSTREISPTDNSLTVNYTIPINSELFLHQAGGIGDVSFVDTDSGVGILNNHFDDIQLTNKTLLKNLYLPENYTIKTESKSTFSSSTMKLVLNVGDVE